MGEQADCITQDFIPRPRKRLKCRYCGSSAVYWEDTRHGWRLANINGGLHECDAYRKHKESIDGNATRSA